MPVYEQLGDTHSLLIGRTKTALLLWQIDAEQHQAEIQNLLQLALADAKQMQIPEAEQIEGIMQRLHSTPTQTAPKANRVWQWLKGRFAGKG